MSQPSPTPKVVAIIPHYFPERVRSLWEAVRHLQQQTLPPEDIVVWDNTGALTEIPPALRDRVHLSISKENVGPGARFLVAAGLTTRVTHVLFQDNDVWLAPTSLHELHYWSGPIPNSVVALEGRVRFPAKPYHQWPKVYGNARQIPTRVDVVLGRADLVPTSLLDRILSNIPYPPMPEMDDLAFSAACGRLGITCWVVPGPPLKNVQAGVGMCHEPDYYARRDAEAKRLVWEVPHGV